MWQSLGSLALVLAAFAAPAGAQPVVEGVVVREIRTERRPIFDQATVERFPYVPLSLVNRLHVTTRDRVIRRELVVAENAGLDPEALQESERKLRRLGLFTDVQVFAVPAPGDSVDVVVRTRELWTTSVDAAYESFEGERIWRLSLRERNLFGTARRIGFRVDSGVDRSSWSLDLSDPQMFDGRWFGALNYRDADDGISYGARLDKRFVSLTDRFALSSRFSRVESAPRFYLDSGTFVRPDATFRDIEFEGALRVAATTRKVWRAVAGFQLESQDLSADEPLPVTVVRGEAPEDFVFDDTPRENRSWRTPYVGFVQRTRRYEELRFINGMGKVEDFPIGLEFDVRLGWTTRLFESTESGARLRSQVTASRRAGNGGLQAATVGLDGLVREGGGRQLVLSWRARSVRQLRPGMTFAAAVRGGAISQPERNRVFSLGLESGLRAARFREFNGDRLWIANVEFRAAHPPGLFDIVVPGVAVFADVGACWFEVERDFQPSLLRGAYGIGLRFGFSAASDDRPVRLDLAWPALYDSDRASPVLSLGTGHVF